MNSNNLEKLKAVFNNIDSRAKIWSIGNKLSPYLPGTVDFDGESFGISIIDQFSGKQPLLMSRSTLNGENKVALIPTILLDSNIVSCLNEYRLKPDYRKNEMGKVVRRMIEKFIETGYDYNPVFYFTEATAKNDSKTLRPYAQEMAATIFAFHSMDEQHFLDNDEIIPDPAAITYYLEHFGVKSASEIPDAFLDKTIFSENRPDLTNCCDSIYAVLLKMILIHLGNKSPISQKLGKLKDFFDNDLGHQMAREFLIATDYFSGNCDKFISLKRGSDWEKQRPKLMATAWDIFLLRIPELLLASGDQFDAPLAYVCTAEKSLRTLGKLFSIQAISCMPPDVTTPVPMIEYDFSRIEEKFGADITASIQRIAPTLLNSVEELTNKTPRTKKPLPELIASLEQEVRSLCK